MSILRFRGGMGLDPDGQWVHYDDHRAEVERLTAEIARITEDRDSWETEAGVNDALARGQLDAIALERERNIARAEVERLTAERDTARAERDQPESRPKGRERGRFGLDGHYLYGMEPARPSDEDIWREAFMVQLMKSSSYQWERSSEEADLVLATYRKRWPHA